MAICYPHFCVHVVVIWWLSAASQLMYVSALPCFLCAYLNIPPVISLIVLWLVLLSCVSCVLILTFIMVFISSCSSCNISYCFVACSSVLCRASGWPQNCHHLFIVYQNQIWGLLQLLILPGYFFALQREVSICPCLIAKDAKYILRKYNKVYLFQDPDFHRKINWDHTEFGEGMNLPYPPILFRNNRDKIHRRVILLVVFCVGFHLGRCAKFVGVLTVLK
jgi:hypothetical protein